MHEANTQLCGNMAGHQHVPGQSSQLRTWCGVYILHYLTNPLHVFQDHKLSIVGISVNAGGDCLAYLSSGCEQLQGIVLCVAAAVHVKQQPLKFASVSAGGWREGPSSHDIV